MKTRYNPPKPGVNYDSKTGKLFVFKPSSITVMKAWPPLAWQKTRRKPNWSHVRPGIKIPCHDIEDHIRRITTTIDETGQLLLPLFMPDEYINFSELAWLQWFANIPFEIRDTACRFSKRQWHMLSLLARCGNAAYDLSISNPALAFALASNWVYRKPSVHRPLRSARALLKPGKKQKDILYWLQFPKPESTRKILAKIVPSALDIPMLLYVREAINNKEMNKAMAHLHRLNAGSIRITTDPELFPIASFALLEEIAIRRKEDERPKVAYILRDTLNMLRLLFPNKTRLAPIKCLTQLETMHDSLVEDLNRAKLLDRDIPFPAVPVEGNESIRPITNAIELIEEGKVQNNCVASYIDKVAVQQQVYVYKVLSPERCTLAIQQRTGKWVLAELKRSHNTSASKETHRAVAKWLKNAISGPMP